MCVPIRKGQGCTDSRNSRCHFFPFLHPFLLLLVVGGGGPVVGSMFIRLRSIVV